MKTTTKKLDVIPAIDLMEGFAVRLQQGDFARKTIYDRDPVGLAQRFEDAGMRALHLVDLDGAKAGKPQNLRVLEGIRKATALRLDFGGGVREEQQVRSILSAGAHQVSVGSMAQQAPDQFRAWVETFGPGVFLLCADLKGGKVAVNGWQESSQAGWEAFLKTWTEVGIQRVLVTAIERDGMLTGPDFALYAAILEAFPQLELIASGGVSGAEDLERLQEMGVPGVVVGKAIYEGKINWKELAQWA